MLVTPIDWPATWHHLDHLDAEERETLDEQERRDKPRAYDG